MPDTLTSPAFAELVVRYRRSAGLSQGELASRCGISERAVRNIESGATARPRRHTIHAIGVALGLAGSELSRLVALARATPAPLPPTEQNVPTYEDSDLVGRTAQLRTVAELVLGGRSRLLSVTGPSGVGKTRLAAEVVGALGSRAGIEVRGLDLSATTDARLVDELVAEALGVGGQSRLAPLDRVVAQLRGRRVLLVLDSFERVLAAAGWIRTLIQRCPGLTVLATSQVRLAVFGEREVRVDPLPVPTGTDLAAIRAVPSVQLLVRRAALVRPGFALTRDNAAALARICRQVDGLPLGIELAAARLRLLTPAELSARLDRRLEMLAGGPAGAPQRHRSLRAAIESSLDVVGAPARDLFAWLGAFAGGVLLADLELVAEAQGHGPEWLLTALGELVDASLVRASAEGDATRYVMPAAMAELAGEWLTARPDGRRLARAVAVRYLDLVRQGTTGRGRAGAGRDADNVRAALAWLTAHEPALIDRPAVEAVYAYHQSAGRCAEGGAVLAGIAAAPGTRPATGGYALVRAGKLAAARHDLDTAARLGAQGLQVLDADDHAGRVNGHLLLGEVATHGGDLPTGRVQIGYALAHAQAAGDQHLVGRALNNLGNLAMQQGDLDEARLRLEEALDIRRRFDSGPVDVACTLSNLAEVALERAEHGAAAELAVEVARLTLAAGRSRMAADALSLHALALLDQGLVAEAAHAATRATGLLTGSDEDQRIVGGIVGLRCSVVLHAAHGPGTAAPILAASVARAKRYIERVDVAVALERHAALSARRAPATAARLLGAARRNRDAFPRPVAPADLRRVDDVTRACRSALGADRFRREHRHGERLDESGLAALCASLHR